MSLVSIVRKKKVPATGQTDTEAKAGCHEKMDNICCIKVLGAGCKACHHSTKT